jgi:hypothetical protein
MSSNRPPVRPATGPRHEYARDVVERVIDLYKAGATLMETGFSAGMSHTTVRKLLRQNGVDIRSKSGRPEKSLSERFFAKVDQNGPVPAHCPELGPCHVWTGARRQGVAALQVDGRNTIAARVAWFLETGAWPTLCVLHKCDGGDRGCVRFGHLFEGTRLDNNRDRSRKGRTATGNRAAWLERRRLEGGT